VSSLLNELACGLSSGPLDNLEFAAKVLAKAAQADCFIAICEDGGINFDIIAGSGATRPECSSIFECAAVERRTIIDDVTIAMCAPILTEQRPHRRSESANMRQDKGMVYKPVLGCIYFQAANGSNRFAEFSKELSGVTNLLANCLEYYQQFQTASTDRLTGALTRKYMDVRLEEGLSAAKRNKTPLSVIMIDLDYFKHVNDTYGHQVGDDVLRNVTKVVRANLRKDDILGRYGGEEFAIILDGMNALASAEYAESLRKAIHDARVLGNKRDITASFGVASYPEHASSVKILIDRADKALYIAKQSGRNRCIAWNDEYENISAGQGPEQEFFSGNIGKDVERMRSLYKIMDITAQDAALSDKMEQILDEVMNITGAGDVTLFLAKYGSIADSFRLNQNLRTAVLYNDRIIESVLKACEPVCLVDWDNDKIDIGSIAQTDWQSIVVSPCMHNGEIKGVLYASVSVATKEFSSDEASYIHNAATIISAMIR